MLAYQFNAPAATQRHRHQKSPRKFRVFCGSVVNKTMVPQGLARFETRATSWHETHAKFRAFRASVVNSHHSSRAWPSASFMLF